MFIADIVIVDTPCCLFDAGRLVEARHSGHVLDSRSGDRTRAAQPLSGS